MGKLPGEEAGAAKKANSISHVADDSLQATS
jgi:hypothetical protein